MAAFVYILCALTSVLCAVLLLRASRRTPTRLLFWSGNSFICLALANVLLFVDLVMVPNYDLLLLRNVITLSGVVMLLYGLIWEAE
jgi:drug/metabolite transporter superfamily protein YnfA